ncbi:hypothetical protein CEXT_284571 [Caerostris extrusa]|uniref:Uncharacterized protein n=1 Tax=Caerostris extrusa TaxID=172846 RepID=A0AAV4TNW8_CAEEX|nr:hypothetical protein CEXT_284571 [Caerostris extrusa]
MRLNTDYVILGRFFVRCLGSYPRLWSHGSSSHQHRNQHLCHTARHIGQQCFRLHHQGRTVPPTRSEVGDGYGNRKDPTPSPTSTVGPTSGLRRRRTRVQGHRQDQRARNRRQRPGRSPHQQPLRRTRRPSRQPRGPLPLQHRIAVAAPLAYGGIVGGGVIGHGAALGLGYGAGILGTGIGKALI